MPVPKFIALVCLIFCSSTTVSPKTTAPPIQSPEDQYFALKSLATKTVQAAQTGRMSSLLNLDIVSIEVADPEPPRELPKGWKRATPADGKLTPPLAFQKLTIFSINGAVFSLNWYCVWKECVNRQADVRYSLPSFPLTTPYKSTIVDHFAITIASSQVSCMNLWLVFQLAQEMVHGDLIKLKQWSKATSQNSFSIS